MKKQLIMAVLFGVVGIVGVAFAWRSPVLQALCAADSNSYSFSINLTPESNQNIQFSWSSNYSNPWTVNFVTSGLHTFTTNKSGTTLWARYVSDHNAAAHVNVNSSLCVTPTPMPSPTVTPTPIITPVPTVTPTATPTPSPTPEITPTPTATVIPEPTPTPTPTPEVTPTPTPDPTINPTPEPTPIVVTTTRRRSSGSRTNFTPTPTVTPTSTPLVAGATNSNIGKVAGVKTGFNTTLVAFIAALAGANGYLFYVQTSLGRKKELLTKIQKQSTDKNKFNFLR